MTRLGFAGVGALGAALVNEVPKFAEQLSTVAVQDVRLDVANAIAARCGGVWAGARFDDLLARDDVDAVVICSPNALHAAQAQAALRAGKHVLVQKPLALSRADADATLAVASKRRRLLFVDYSYRFLETVDILRQQVADSGPPRRARAMFHNIYGPGQHKAWFFDPRLSGGGALIDLGVHLLDLGLWLFQPRHVALALADLDGNGGVEAAAHLAVRLDDVPLEVEVSWNAPRAATEIAVEVEMMSGGRARWENVEGSFFRFRTLRDGRVLCERETTLREDTLRAFVAALAQGAAPVVDTRVYSILDGAYGRAAAPA